MICGFFYSTLPLFKIPVFNQYPPSIENVAPNLVKPSKSSYSIPENPSFTITTDKREITDNINVSNISIPTVNIATSLNFIPSDSSFTMPNIPSTLIVDNIPPIDYEKFKIPISLYDTIMFPISISFPPLPVSQDVLIPDFNINISIPTNEMLYIDSDKYPFNLAPTNSFNYNVKGTFLINNNVNTDDEFSFIRERRYIKDLINSFMSDLDSIHNIDFLFLQLSNNYINESNKFYKHLSDKERALLKVELAMKIYKEILNYKINRLEAILAQTREKASLFITVNKELINTWESKQSLKELLYKNFIDKVKKDSTLYNIVNKVNSDIRELFYFYNNLILYTIETTVLNIERERLLIDLSIAVKEVDTAKSREQIPPLKIEVLKNQIKVIEERYKRLLIEASSLQNKLESSIAKKDSYNANLLATKSEIDASVTKLNMRSSTLNVEYDIKLLERVMNNYIRLIEEYYSIMRNMWTSYYDTQKYSQVSEILSALYYSATSKIDNIYNNYNMIANAYAYFIQLHAWASQMIANANITSNVIEAYR